MKWLFFQVYADPFFSIVIFIRCEIINFCGKNKGKYGVFCLYVKKYRISVVFYYKLLLCYAYLCGNNRLKAIKLFKHENKTFSINAGVWCNERLCPADRLSQRQREHWKWATDFKRVSLGRQCRIQRHHLSCIRIKSLTLLWSAMERHFWRLWIICVNLQAANRLLN